MFVSYKFIRKGSVTVQKPAKRKNKILKAVVSVMTSFALLSVGITSVLATGNVRAV